MTRRRTLWIVGAAAFIGAVVWLLWPPSEKPFYDYVAERRAAGMATTFDEFRGPMPPASENGAEDLNAAWEALLADFGPSTMWKGSAFDDSAALSGPWPDTLRTEQLDELAKTAERLRPGIDPFLRALEKPRLVFPVKFDPNGMRDRPDVGVIQQTVRVLMMPAAADPDSARRIAACRALALLAERLEPETMLDAMLRGAARASAVAALRRGVESGEMDAAQARAACDTLLRSSHLDALRRGCRGEAVELIEMYGALVEGRATPWTAQLSPWKRLTRHLEQSVRRLTGASGLFDSDLEPGNARLVVSVCRLRDASAGLPDLRELTKPDGVAAIDPDGITRPGGFNEPSLLVTKSALRYEAASRLARVALAAAEFRATHGDFPSSLDELKPLFADGVPLDPYVDAPFVYQRTATSVRIASAGRLADEAPLDEPALREKCLVWELKK